MITYLILNMNVHQIQQIKQHCAKKQTKHIKVRQSSVFYRLYWTFILPLISAIVLKLTRSHVLKQIYYPEATKSHTYPIFGLTSSRKKSKESEREREKKTNELYIHIYTNTQILPQNKPNYYIIQILK